MVTVKVITKDLVSIWEMLEQTCGAVNHQNVAVSMNYSPFEMINICSFVFFHREHAMMFMLLCDEAEII